MKFISTLIICLALAGCGSQVVIKKEVVTVDRPVAFVPVPPFVPKFDSQVDKLTDADITDPGKIGQAYKYDMFALRSLNKIYESILDQYKKSSQDFDKINEQVKQLVSDINTAEASRVKAIADEAAKKR